MKKVKISNYSSFNNYTVKDQGTNHSDIVTKMVQLAGRLCERYASDIIYDANAFIKAIEKKQDFERFLFFREMGVTAFKMEDIKASHHDGTNYAELKELTCKGSNYAADHRYDSDREVHEKLWNSNFYTRLPHYAHKVWGCKKGA